MTNVNLSEKAQEANKALDKLDHLSKTKLKEHINRRCLRNQIDLARNMVVHGSEQGILDGLRDLRSYIKCSFGEDTIQELLSIIEI